MDRHELGSRSGARFVNQLTIAATSRPPALAAAGDVDPRGLSILEGGCRRARIRCKIDVPLVARLVAAQFPEWADLPIAPVENGGWDNRTFRLGDGHVGAPAECRVLPQQVAKEQRWLPRLAPLLPLPIPVPLAHGETGGGLSVALVGLPLDRRRDRDARRPSPT